MGHKKVCFNCRKTFSIPSDATIPFSLTCPECSGQTTIFNQRFRPPTKDDIKKWKVIEFLKENGFVFQHVYKDKNKKSGIDSHENHVKYPLTMDEAKDFVSKYKDQSIMATEE